jgi:MinD superfamily P-loop ATPase
LILTVASGKGGTGKTTVAVNLALSLATGTDMNQPLFLDCDVEEPNAALFLKPTIAEWAQVERMIPEVDREACNYCGRCAEVCQYHAIAVVREQVLIFPELCHGCGSCALNCPTGAIHEVPRTIGTLERGWAGSIAYAQGTMNVGEAMSTPIIRQLKRWAMTAGTPVGSDHRPVILDAPPGTACPVVEAMRGSDMVLMVTEPTPFGLHDLRLAVEVARDEMRLPVAVAVNREGVGDRGVDAYCAAEDIPIVMHIPLDRRIAEAYADGVPLIEVLPAYQERFVALWKRLTALTANYPDTRRPTRAGKISYPQGTPEPCPSQEDPKV